MVQFFAGLLMQVLVLLGLAAPMPSQPTPADNSRGVACAQDAKQCSDGTYVSRTGPNCEFAACPTGSLDTATTTAAAPIAPSSTVAPASDALPAGSAWLTTLPLGDGKYVTTGPKQGYIYLCHLATNGRGAQGSATWIHGDTWNPAEKVAVQGAVAWPSAAYSMYVSGTTRKITANGLPTDHDSGTFPIQRSDPAYHFDANPNSIRAQQYSYSLPATPTELRSPDCIFGQVGIMKDGVPLFDGFDAEYRDAVAHETQDAWEAHPDGQDVYHYHGFEFGWVKDSVSTVVGFAFDGYPITGSKLSNGNYLHTSDLDECHGITSTVELDGKQVTTYHYVLTQDFPYSVSCFRGKSYEPRPGSGQNGTQQAGQTSSGTQAGPPAQAISACSGKSAQSACSFTTPQGTVSGTCMIPPGQNTLACVPK